MNTTAILTPEVRDVEVDLGFLFGYVTATRIGDTVGAHVKLNPDSDESVIGNTDLVRIDPDADPLDVARALRRVAATAIAQAAAEVGVPMDRPSAEILAAMILPLSPILEAMIEAGL